MLFHEIYSNYYVAVSSILKEAVRGTLTGKKLNAIVLEHAFGESLLTIPDGLKGEKWRLIHKDLSTPLKGEPSMPLTQLKEAPAKTVTFELEDRRNAMERVLLHFSHLEKETKRLDKCRYRVTLKYDRQDETEMVIRILSFGSAIRVTEPESFVTLIRERIRKQLAFQKNNIFQDIFQDGRETDGRSRTKDVSEANDISEKRCQQDK